jgi:hypothetical protein
MPYHLGDVDLFQRKLRNRTRDTDFIPILERSWDYWPRGPISILIVETMSIPSLEKYAITLGRPYQSLLR